MYEPGVAVRAHNDQIDLHLPGITHNLVEGRADTDLLMDGEILQAAIAGAAFHGGPRRGQELVRRQGHGRRGFDSLGKENSEVLDERARTTYAQRTSYLGGNGGLATDSMALDRNLEAVYPKTRAPESTAHTVADGNLSRASDREVNR